MTDEHATNSPDLDELRLAIEVQQLAINRLSSELEQVADQAAEGITALREQVGSLANVGGRRPTAKLPWSWRDLDAEATQVLMVELGDWLEWLHGRYPLSESIPPCWSQHPEMVEEITAAHAAWKAAYRDPDASPFAPAEWHERWMPGLEHRMTHRWKARRCEAGHQPRSRSGSVQAVRDADSNEQAS